MDITARNLTKQPVQTIVLRITASLSEMSTKNILAIGLSSPPPGADISTEELRSKISAQIDEARDYGFQVDMIMFEPEDFPTALEQLKEKLKSKPDGFIVGMGLRAVAKFTEIFEDCVNACREISPGTRMGFNTRSSDMVECMKRNFG